MNTEAVDISEADDGNGFCEVSSNSKQIHSKRSKKKVDNSLEEDRMSTSEAQINATTLVTNEEAITPSKYQRVLPQSGRY